MLENCKTAQERWGGVHRLIDKWLNDRQQLIVQYYGLSSCQPLANDYNLGEAITRLCESIVDYCSVGHFEIYEQLINEAKEYDDGGLDVARELVPRLDELTTRCVDFNDTYDQHCCLDDLVKLPQDLSSIGEVLEERFELEDQLIEKLHNIHRETATE